MVRGGSVILNNSSSKLNLHVSVKTGEFSSELILTHDERLKLWITASMVYRCSSVISLILVMSGQFSNQFGTGKLFILAKQES